MSHVYSIIIRFGCPKELVSDRGIHFINSTNKHLTNKYLIIYHKSSYHPRANGQIEKTNGILCEIITKTFVKCSNNDWDERFLKALWAYCTAYKVTTKHIPFQLVYGQKAIFPIELEVPSLRIAIDERLGDEISLKHCYAMLKNLDEFCAQVYLSVADIQQSHKTYYNNKINLKTLNPNDLIFSHYSFF